MLEKATRMNVLYDRYGTLLSEKQQHYMQLYYLDDLTLGEIAEESEVSRQAVYDQIRRAEAQLELFEAKMQLLHKATQREAIIGELATQLQGLAHYDACSFEPERGLQLLKRLRELD